MLFNSLQFALFFAIVYFVYIRSSFKIQNRILLVASYFFYGAWDWRFLSLIVLSTVLDYFCGIKISETGNLRKRKIFLSFSIIGNIGILGFFKYYNFFTSSLADILTSTGLHLNPVYLKIILPVGISFYTFQTLSYTLDIYHNKLEPTYKFLDFALFVSFFPQLVAGPIERAKHLLPQILNPRKVTLDKFYEGSYLIFWGLFQKVFIADNLAKLVDPVFLMKPVYSGVTVLLALYAFAFQIFCDFAGYSNMARGLGKVMGFDIMVNFNLPYFATNPKEFWQRWHISLSTWLKDYLYIPLGGNRGGTRKMYRNLALTMVLGGLWHGASWTFIIWGIYQGFLLITYRSLTGKPKSELLFRDKDFLNKCKTCLNIIFFFHLVCIGWLFFRSQSFLQASHMISALFFNFKMSDILLHFIFLQKFFLTVSVLLFVQILQYWKNDLMIVYKMNVPFKLCFYLICFYLFLIHGVGGGKEFIYFQF